MQKTYLVTVDGRWEGDGKRKMYWVKEGRIIRAFLFVPWQKRTEADRLDETPYQEVTVTAQYAFGNGRWKDIPFHGVTKEAVEREYIQLLLRAPGLDPASTKVLFFREADPTEEAEVLQSATPTIPPPERELDSEPVLLARRSDPPTPGFRVPRPADLKRE